MKRGNMSVNVRGQHTGLLQIVLQMISEHGELTLKQLKKMLPHGHNSISPTISHAVRFGLIAKVRNERGTPYKLVNPISIVEGKVKVDKWHGEITPLSWRHQETRRRLAEIERAGLSYEQRVGVVRVA